MVRVAEYWSREKVPAVLLKLSDGMVLYEKQYLGIKGAARSKGRDHSGAAPDQYLQGHAENHVWCRGAGNQCMGRQVHSHRSGVR